jgi:hypothetical protein
MTNIIRRRKMSNENRRPWYTDPRIVIPAVIAIVAIVVTLITNWPSSNFSISVNPMRGEVRQGGVIFTAITLKGEHRYKEAISLRASGQPSGVVVTFAPQIGKPAPTFTSYMIMSVGLDVPTDSYEIMTEGIGADGKEHSCKYILRVISEAKIIEIEDEEYKYAATKDSEVFHILTVFM